MGRTKKRRNISKAETGRKDSSELNIRHEHPEARIPSIATGSYVGRDEEETTAIHQKTRQKNVSCGQQEDIRDDDVDFQLNYDEFEVCIPKDPNLINTEIYNALVVQVR